MTGTKTTTQRDHLVKQCLDDEEGDQMMDRSQWMGSEEEIGDADATNKKEQILHQILDQHQPTVVKQTQRAIRRKVLRMAYYMADDFVDEYGKAMEEFDDIDSFCHSSQSQKEYLQEVTSGLLSVLHTNSTIGDHITVKQEEKEYARYLGRQFPVARKGKNWTPHSVAQLPKPLRDYLCRGQFADSSVPNHGGCYDIDMSNAHPSNMKWMCEAIACKTPKGIIKYMKHRETILQELINRYEAYGVDRKVAKSYFLAIFYNGGHHPRMWYENNNIPVEKDWMPSYAKAIMNDVQMFVREFKKKHPQTWNDICPKDKSGDALERSRLSFVINQMEKKILNFMQNKTEEIYNIPVKDMISEYDGFKIPANGKSREEIEKIVNNIQDLTRQEFQFDDLSLEIKPLEQHDYIDTLMERYNKMSEEELGEEEEADWKEIEKTIHEEGYNEGTHASIYTKFYNQDFTLLDDQFHHWNGVYWELDHGNYALQYDLTTRYFFSIRSIALSRLEKQEEEIQSKIYNAKQADDKDEVNRCQSELKNIQSEMKNAKTWVNDIIRKDNGLQRLIHYIRTFMYQQSKGIETDKKPNLLTFENGVYDLYKGQWIEPQRTDYVSKSTGFPYKEPTEESQTQLDQFLDSVFEDQEQKKCLLQMMAGSLLGEFSSYLLILRGKGGNGKSVLTGILQKAFADLAQSIPNEQFIKGGRKDNPTMATLGKKRFVVTQEPPEKTSFDTSMIKSITGSATINARGLYQQKTSHPNHGSYLVECNRLPDFDTVDEALHRRIIVVDFPNVFKTNHDPDHDPPNFKPAIPYFGTEEFQENVRDAMVHKLLHHYIGRREECPIPQKWIDASKSYLNNCGIMNKFLNENLQRTGDGDDVLKIADIYDRFRYSELHENLSKKDKREMNRKYFIEEISSDPRYVPFYYKEKYITKRDEDGNTIRDSKGKYQQAKARNILIGYQLTPEEEDEDDE